MVLGSEVAGLDPEAVGAPIQRPASVAESPEPEMEDLPPPVEDPPPPTPQPTPLPRPSMEPVVASSTPAEAEPAAREPRDTVLLPTRTGRGLMYGSIAAGVAGWGFALGTIGVLQRDCPGLLGCSEEFVVLSGFRWMANGAALGLAIPAAVLRGRYDAIDERNTGRPSRNIDAFIKGGAVALGLGAGLWTIARVSPFTFLPGACSEGPRCGTLYVLGIQTGWAAAATGAGLLSYGLAHREQRRKLGISHLRVTPQLTADYSGFALGGRF
ncbi:MAG: hypothetical protein AAGA54_05490 [Myxococcota bacterium]